MSTTDLTQQYKQLYIPQKRIMFAFGIVLLTMFFLGLSTFWLFQIVSETVFDIIVFGGMISVSICATCIILVTRAKYGFKLNLNDCDTKANAVVVSCAWNVKRGRGIADIGFPQRSQGGEYHIIVKVEDKFYMKTGSKKKLETNNTVEVTYNSDNPKECFIIDGSN